MNSKGQTFDVFKLLISAIVAAAILMILLSILHIDIFQWGKDPTSTATDSLKSQMTNLSTPILTDVVTFKPQSSLNASTLASKSIGISIQQICLLVGNIPNKANFSTNKSDLIIFEGKSDQKVRMAVLCDRAKDISTTIERYGWQEKFGIDPQLSACEKAETTESTYCVIALVADAS